jgi:hypothetical protein
VVFYSLYFEKKLYKEIDSYYKENCWNKKKIALKIKKFKKLKENNSKIIDVNISLKFDSINSIHKM